VVPYTHSQPVKVQEHFIYIIWICEAHDEFMEMLETLWPIKRLLRVKDFAINVLFEFGNPNKTMSNSTSLIWGRLIRVGSRHGVPAHMKRFLFCLQESGSGQREFPVNFLRQSEDTDRPLFTKDKEIIPISHFHFTSLILIFLQLLAMVQRLFEIMTFFLVDPPPIIIIYIFSIFFLILMLTYYLGGGLREVGTTLPFSLKPRSLHPSMMNFELLTLQPERFKAQMAKAKASAMAVLLL